MAWKDATFRLTGVAPLLLHNGALADPLSPATKALAKVTVKKKKTEADHLQIQKLEWNGSLYLNPKRQIVIPGDVLTAVAIEGARKDKRGKQFSAGVFSKEDAVLTSKTPEDLWDEPAYRLTAGVRVGQKRVMRTRPLFPQWAIEAVFSFDPDQVDEEHLLTALIKAGNEVGIGDWRPRFGRFTVERLA